MTDMAPIQDPAWALAEHVYGSGLADPRTTARNAVRLRSDDAVHDDAVHADIHMIRHLGQVPKVSNLPRHFG
jgi:hypothetical protein